MPISGRLPHSWGLRDGLAAIVIGVLACAGCSRQSNGGTGGDASPESATQDLAGHGTIEVTARLVEIPGLEQWKGRFPSNDLGYDYVYVLKYEVEAVHRGDLNGETILVGQYNPLKPRDQAADARCPDIGGNLRRFRVGDVHRMALDVPIDDYYMGPIINKYFDTQGEAPIYWAVRTNAAAK